jgi:hypothetical protein
MGVEVTGGIDVSELAGRPTHPDKNDKNMKTVKTHTLYNSVCILLFSQFILFTLFYTLI